MAASSDRVFVFRFGATDDDGFRRFADHAAKLKPYGRVLVYVDQLADKSRHELPPFRSPWHEYAVCLATLHKVFPHPEIARHLPSGYAERNRELLLKRARMLRERGLGAAFHAVEPYFMPEPFFAEHPSLRGARVDHPRRSMKAEFAMCVDRDETAEMYAWMMRELKRNVPELELFSFLINDSGSGLCWASKLYPGPNGPSCCQTVGAVRHLVKFCETLHRGAVEGGGDVDIEIGGRMSLKLGDQPVEGLPPRTAYLGKGGGVGTGTHFGHTSPIRGIADIPAVIKALERAVATDGRKIVFTFSGLYYKAADSVEAAGKVVDVAKEFFASPVKGPMGRTSLLYSLARRWAGDASADALVEAWEEFSRALSVGAMAGGFGSYYFLSMRYICRPIVIRPDLLTPEEENYFLPHVFNVSEKEAREDFIDIHGGRHSMANVGAMPLSWSSGWFYNVPLQSALAAARRVAETLESLKDAPERGWLMRTAMAIRLWVGVVRSSNNIYMAQLIRDRHREELSGPPQVHPKLRTSGDPDLLQWYEILRDELDNTDEMIGLLERGGLELVARASDPADEDTFMLGPDLIGALRKKREIMLRHWREAEDYLVSHNT
ncbi:MAG: hypothetical protein N3A38_02730 [Planctomycetota bacterium]|nr:hypothetical protein [Planctomycetota bacterium]